MSDTNEAPKRGRGRPPFLVTPALRLKVEEMAAASFTIGQIASVLNCDRDTVMKYFSDEIENGPARRHQEAMDLLWASARKGNVSAQKAVEAITNRAHAERQFEQAVAAHAPDEQKADKLGKKEIRAIDAANAGVGTEWGDDLQAGLPN